MISDGARGCQSSVYDIDLADGKVVVRTVKMARAWEKKIEEMLLQETIDLTLAPEEIVRRYKELAEIKRSFRAMKLSLMLRPGYYWAEARIRAHVFLTDSGAALATEVMWDFS